MRTATTALRLEPDLKHRAEALAEAEHRSFSAVVRDALQMYLGKREAEQTDEMSAWLRTWGTDDESEPPECHL